MSFKSTAAMLAFYTAAAAAVMTVGCNRPTQEEIQKAQDTKMEELEQSDRSFLKKAGFEITARAGYGWCDKNGEIKTPVYWGGSTDMTYILQKPGDANTVYTVCMTHTSGETVMRNLRTVERYAPPGAPRQ
ncbi:MAG: hypothetical protein ACAH80_11245 [Alphaproteobacteria bacterium]